MTTDQLTQEQVEGVLAESQQVAREAARANAHLLEKDTAWRVPGTMYMTATFFYFTLRGQWRLDTGKTLSFNGELGGIGLGGGEFKGEATFFVSTDELCASSVHATVSAAQIVGGGMKVTFTRDGRLLGVFVGGGVGFVGGNAIGSGKFTV